MNPKIVFSALIILALVPCESAAQIDPDQSWATIQNPPATIGVAPGAWEGFMNPSDHLIDVYVYSYSGFPVELVASDIWLDDDAAQPCPGGWTPDSSTFAPDPGHTTFSGTPQGGVELFTPCRSTYTDVIAAGYVIENDLDLRFVSPDLDGNGNVDIQDFPVFAACYYAPCTDGCWCADLDRSDDIYPNPCVSLPDFALFAQFYNDSHCP